MCTKLKISFFLHGDWHPLLLLQRCSWDGDSAAEYTMYGKCMVLIFLTPTEHNVATIMQVVSKSCKVVPVMLVGKFVHGKSYPWVEYLEVS